ncbi:MAG: DNA-binding protein WhiA [Candidatus Eremiobacteraeota bacterium]|nr:DNA-binding protein WhiA [Candidatus Eremiobacteraeota bacterium]
MISSAPPSPRANRSNLSADAKDAVARDVPADPGVRAALRAGLAYFGCVESGATRVFRTRRAAVARLARTLFEERRPGASVRRGHDLRLYRTTTFDIELGDEANVPPPKPRRRDERRGELRAAFLCAGSLAAPQHGYHLEFVFRDARRAERAAALIAGEGVTARRMRRKARWVVYLKGLDAIVTVLGAVGASGAVLQLEDVRAVKETKNRIRRLVNTDAANVVRAASAAAKQREAIAYLADAYGLRNLSPVLREAAQLRLAHPDETLTELGRRCSPAVGKATMNGRIAALMRLVRRLRAPREEPEVSPA